MAIFRSFVFLLTLVAIARCLDLDLARIVGGHEVSIDDFPYQLSVRRNDTFVCGGALIGIKYGLSAAHCFRFTGLYSVRAGSDLKDSGGIIAYLKTVILHPERTSKDLRHDIAILELQVPLVFSNTIQPVKLPENDGLIIPGINGVISGFGDTISSEDARGSTILRAAEVSIQSHDICQSNYLEYTIYISPAVFCAGVSEGGKDSCQGDSGGPFVIDNTLYGLVSFGINCGEPDHPGVYTNVAAYREYIRLNTGI